MRFIEKLFEKMGEHMMGHYLEEFAHWLLLHPVYAVIIFTPIFAGIVVLLVKKPFRRSNVNKKVGQ